MVGGGIGAFIGNVHRMAATMDSCIELVCGAFSSSAEKSALSGKELHLPEDRVYGSYAQMFAAEQKLPLGERMDFVTIVTQNKSHFEIAKMALEHGFHVICDKPMTFNLQEAQDLVQVVEQSGKLFGLTHVYTGYPMVKEARAMIKQGLLGNIRKVVAEYPQGWLASCPDMSDNWRTNPAIAGASCCMGDIGTHANNLVEYITGLYITELCADLTCFVEGSHLDDDGNILVHFNNGAKGILYASQVCIGEENTLTIRVYGEKGSLFWEQQEPNTLIAKWLDKPAQIIRTGGSVIGENSSLNVRLPAGHPEGFIEAFANIYRNFALSIDALLNGETPSENLLDFPTAQDGLRGMAFIDTIVKSGTR